MRFCWCLRGTLTKIVAGFSKHETRIVPSNLTFFLQIFGSSQLTGIVGKWHWYDYVGFFWCIGSRYRYVGYWRGIIGMKLSEVYFYPLQSLVLSDTTKRCRLGTLGEWSGWTVTLKSVHVFSGCGAPPGKWTQSQVEYPRCFVHGL